MDFKTKFTDISIEEHDAIENEMYEKGYLTYGYVVPAKIIDTDVSCPVCGENLTLYVSGNSYRITCKSNSCVVLSFRGL
jgi:hypothetical protein